MRFLFLILVDILQSTVTHPSAAELSVPRTACCEEGNALEYRMEQDRIGWLELSCDEKAWIRIRR
jgi:hypothetical protein